MTELAIIGGTGLETADFLTINKKHEIETPYGQTSSLVVEAKINDHRLWFLSRHGENHLIAPHKINYRANIWALYSLGIKNIIAVAAVGGIKKNMPPQTLMMPNQIIDYTWGREHTFFTEDQVRHIEFSNPYCESLRTAIIDAAEKSNIKINPTGAYGATQGPRLETAAEIKRMRQDGCDIVGMTGMPEAALARELNLCYAAICICANWAAGISAEAISMDKILENLEKGMRQTIKLICEIVKS